MYQVGLYRGFATGQRTWKHCRRETWVKLDESVTSDVLSIPGPGVLTRYAAGALLIQCCLVCATDLSVAFVMQRRAMSRHSWSTKTAFLALRKTSSLSLCRQ